MNLNRTMTPHLTMNTTMIQTLVLTYQIATSIQIQVTSVFKYFQHVIITNVNTAPDINLVLVDVAINLNKAKISKKTYHYECRTQCYTFLVTNWCVNYRMTHCIAYSIHHKDCRCRPYRHA